MFVNDADAVLFYSRSWIYFKIGEISIKDVPKTRNRDQQYVFVTNEPPNLTLLDLKLVPFGFFNLTMTYRLDSDIPYVYDRFEKITFDTPSSQRYDWSEVEEAVSQKTKSILQLTTNCRTLSRREAYVEKLKQFISVTQKGRCFQHLCSVWEEEQEIVPIVLKDSIYRTIAPPNSYIAADNFSSPEQLAKYLKHLEEDHNEYIKYFEWRRTYKRVKRQPIVCDLCKFLHQKKKFQKIYENIYEWWIENATCHDDYGIIINSKNSTHQRIQQPTANADPRINSRYLQKTYGAVDNILFHL
ncbi:unnamed protein product [Enterobius vermicularis]|uniref:Fucosyltransferase n=1 Tax=Enterobius vermicularis TaxID=51028 RepID=A0A0N4VA13_ENTVE|nr:unnamed protein product [Enterobius vermicularis]